MLPSSTPVDRSDRVGALASRLPGATRVFERHHIDYCCAGARTVAEAAALRGLDVERVVSDLNATLGESREGVDWTTQSSEALIAHLIERYHEPLRDELPRLLRMAARVREVHGERDPIRLARLVELLTQVTDELLMHIHKEERVLFPLIQAAEEQRARVPAEMMRAEHAELGVQLAELRRLTDDFVPPPGACATWRGLWLGLAEFEREMHAHVHLENNILFARLG